MAVVAAAAGVLACANAPVVATALLVAAAVLLFVACVNAPVVAAVLLVAAAAVVALLTTVDSAPALASAVAFSAAATLSKLGASTFCSATGRLANSELAACKKLAFSAASTLSPNPCCQKAKPSASGSRPKTSLYKSATVVVGASAASYLDVTSATLVLVACAICAGETPASRIVVAISSSLALGLALSQPKISALVTAIISSLLG